MGIFSPRFGVLMVSIITITLITGCADKQAQTTSTATNQSTTPTYANAKWDIAFQYPPNLATHDEEGSSDFMPQFLAIDVATPKQLEQQKSAEGTEGVPLFLRIVVSDPINNPSPTCGESRTQIASLTIDGASAVKCKGSVLGRDVLYIDLIHGKYKYTIQSDQYFQSTENQATIDHIISTIQFAQE